jgi:hypothetical protein
MWPSVEPQDSLNVTLLKRGRRRALTLQLCGVSEAPTGDKASKVQTRNPCKLGSPQRGIRNNHGFKSYTSSPLGFSGSATARYEEGERPINPLCASTEPPARAATAAPTIIRKAFWHKAAGHTKLAALQSLGIRQHANAVMPRNFASCLSAA